MKLFEILNQAKATAEGISVDEAWPRFYKEIQAAPQPIQDFLQTEYNEQSAAEIYQLVLGNLKKT